MILQEGLPDRGDLPVRHLALVHVGGVADRHGHAVAPRHLEELRGVLDRAHDQRRAAQRILRIGEGDLEIDHDDAGLLAEADRDLAVAAVLIIVHVGSLRASHPSCSIGGIIGGRRQELPGILRISAAASRAGLRRAGCPAAQGREGGRRRGVPVSTGLQRRLLDAAAVEGVGAAGVEAAALGRVDRARHVALQDDALARRRRARAPARPRAAPRCRGASERAKIAPLRRHLDDLAEIHHRDAVGHVLDDGEVVADEQERQAELLLQVLQQVDDLRLDRDVERRDRLVADDEVGLGRERAGDADALALPAGELVRPAVHRVARQPHRVHQAPRPVSSRSAADRGEAEIADRLGQDVAHAHARVEARERVLEHHLHAPPQRPQRRRPRGRRCARRRAPPGRR